MVGIFSAWIVVDVTVLQVTGGQSRASFDAMVRQRLLVAAPDPRIVVIDIDEASLQRMATEFGRWPWPRDTLATVLDAIERQQPAAIVWDIVFSDVDRVSPGGDTAFDDAVKRSRHSVFPVVRLPNSDGSSELTGKVLPGLWAPGGIGSQPVALIAPALPAVAAAPLGYNNGYVDVDGVLRRYRPFERLADGSTIRSVAMATLEIVDPARYRTVVASFNESTAHFDELISWRRHSNAYPHVSFADVFDQADSGTLNPKISTFAGKVVLIGSTAASLHDIHPTPLSPLHPGVNSLATVVDNTLNGRHIDELPRWLQAALAIGLCCALGAWVQRRKFSKLLPLSFLVPVLLILVSYATLNGAPIYVDLHLSAALALLFLTLLRYWNQLRRRYWCSMPVGGGEELSLWSVAHPEAWSEEPLDRLIDLVSQVAPDCRILAADLNAIALHPVRWPELARFAAVIGPSTSMLRAHDSLRSGLTELGAVGGKIHLVGGNSGREQICRQAFAVWSKGEGKS